MIDSRRRRGHYLHGQRLGEGVLICGRSGKVKSVRLRRRIEIVVIGSGSVRRIHIEVFPAAQTMEIDVEHGFVFAAVKLGQLREQRLCAVPAIIYRVVCGHDRRAEEGKDDVVLRFDLLQQLCDVKQRRHRRAVFIGALRRYHRSARKRPAEEVVEMRGEDHLSPAAVCRLFAVDDVHARLTRRGLKAHKSRHLLSRGRQNAVLVHFDIGALKGFVAHFFHLCGDVERRFAHAVVYAQLVEIHAAVTRMHLVRTQPLQIFVSGGRGHDLFPIFLACRGHGKLALFLDGRTARKKRRRERKDERERRDDKDLSFHKHLTAAKRPPQRAGRAR